jgi:GAF domain-containing protein
MLSLDSIRSCLEGAVPSSVSTCAADGTPNITLVSQVHYVDSSHVALSFQFFNKTHANVLVNPRATAIVIDPETAAQYQLALHYLRTETSGPLFENMKAKLAGIASHTGMAGIFRLRGSDVYRVSEIQAVSGEAITPRQPRRSVLPALRSCAARLNASCDLSMLLDNALAGLERDFGVSHSMILMLDRAGKRLYTVASRGYLQSGVGSEIALGCGVIGVSAEQGVPIRITHMTAEYSYSRAIRDSVEREGLGSKLETAIPLPGLPESRSQLAVPIVSGTEVLGVLYVESSEDLRFNYDDEDALVTVASQLGTAAHALQQASEKEEAAAVSAPADRTPAAGATSVVRHYRADDSIFIDDDYVIKGVAGAILCKLLGNYLSHKRVDFTNRELRLDPNLGLPDITDNLEARLILLERRLAERRAPLRIEKTGRGRFRLCVERPLTLVEM